MDLPGETRPLTARQRYDAYHATEALRRFEHDMRSALSVYGTLPYQWHEIANRRQSPKDRVTIRIDRDVLKFFKGMHTAYGPMINDVLRAFMHAKLAGLLRDEAKGFGFEEEERLKKR